MQGSILSGRTFSRKSHCNCFCYCSLCLWEIQSRWLRKPGESWLFLPPVHNCPVDHLIICRWNKAGAVEGRKQRHALINCFLPTPQSQHPSLSPPAVRRGSCRQTGSSGCQDGGLPECLYFITVQHTAAKFLRAKFRAENEGFLLAGECKMGRDKRARHELAGYRFDKEKWKKSWGCLRKTNDCLSLNGRLQINFNISLTCIYSANTICDINK